MAQRGVPSASPPLLLLLLALASGGHTDPTDIAATPTTPSQLRTEHQQLGVHPFVAPGVDVRVTWVNTWPDSGTVTAVQAAYEVVVREAGTTTVVLDTGRLPGAAQTYAIHASLLKPEGAYTWTVRTWWSTSPDPSAFADSVAFDVGLTDWAGAQWVGGHNQLRTELSLPAGKTVARARIYIIGLGAFYLYAGGVQVGDHVMDPPQSVYMERAVYLGMDVTSHVKAATGTAVFGIMLGNYKWGYLDMWCNMTTAGGPQGCQRVMFKLRVEYTDHTTATLVSNEDTVVGRAGPVVWDHLFHGETYDARKELEGWASKPLGAWPSPGPWSAAQSREDAPGKIGTLVPMAIPGLRKVTQYAPVDIRRVSDSSVVFDMGQNMAGLATFTLPKNHGIPSGTKIFISHAEIVHLGDGKDTDYSIFDTYCNSNPASESLRLEPCKPHQTFARGHLIADRYVGDFNCANETNVYIVAGKAEGETYTALFAAAGFRYVRVMGLPSGFTPVASMVTAHFVHTDVTSVGELRAAEVPAIGSGTGATRNVLNRIHNLTRNSQLSNLWSVPTDCPQRERRGWMGDAQVACRGLLLNFDMQAFYENFLSDIRHDQARGCAAVPDKGCNPGFQQLEGSVADVVPFDGIGGWPGCIIWQVAYIVIGRASYHSYGDPRILADNYDGFTLLIKHFQANVNTSSGLYEKPCYGDWVDQDGHPSFRTPPQICSSFYYVYALQLMAEISDILGKTAEAAMYTDLHTSGVRAFHSRYYDPAAKGYAPVAGWVARGSQTSQALALALGAPPTAEIRAEISQLLGELVVANGNHSSGGIVGMAWLYDSLEAAGHTELGLAALRADTWPSFGSMVRQNMTTLCESWSCEFHTPGGGSLNHIMFGGYNAWMVTRLGGLSTVSNRTTAGWRHVIVRPNPTAVDLLRSGGYTIETRLGGASLEWSLDVQTKKVTYELAVPFGSTTEVHMPAALQQSLPRHGLEAVFLDGVRVAADGLAHFKSESRREDTLVLHLASRSGVRRIEAVYNQRGRAAQ